jgi:hypothetical protein
MKSQPKVSIKGVVSQYLFPIFLLILLSLFMAGNVQAKKKKPQPSPGPSGPDNTAIWSGDQAQTDILSSVTRQCSLSQAASDESNGKYSCQLNTESILYDFQWLTATPIHTRGDDFLCDAKKMFWYLIPDVEFSYSWNGDCTSASGCGVTVVNDFSNIGFSGGSTVDHITIEGLGTAKTNTANPFSDSQSLSIDSLHVTFYSVKGKNKVAAVCELKPRANFPITFDTTAVPLISNTVSGPLVVRPSSKARSKN